MSVFALGEYSLQQSVMLVIIEVNIFCIYRNVNYYFGDYLLFLGKGEMEGEIVCKREKRK